MPFSIDELLKQCDSALEAVKFGRRWWGAGDEESLRDESMRLLKGELIELNFGHLARNCCSDSSAWRSELVEGHPHLEGPVEVFDAKSRAFYLAWFQAAYPVGTTKADPQA